MYISINVLKSVNMVFFLLFSITYSYLPFFFFFFFFYFFFFFFLLDLYEFIAYDVLILEYKLSSNLYMGMGYRKIILNCMNLIIKIYMILKYENNDVN